MPILENEIKELFELREEEVKSILLPDIITKPSENKKENNIAKPKKENLSTTKSIHEFFKKIEDKKRK